MEGGLFVLAGVFEALGGQDGAARGPIGRLARVQVRRQRRFQVVPWNVAPCGVKKKRQPFVSSIFWGL